MEDRGSVLRLKAEKWCSRGTSCLLVQTLLLYGVSFKHDAMRHRQTDRHVHVRTDKQKEYQTIIVLRDHKSYIKAMTDVTEVSFNETLKVLLTSSCCFLSSSSNVSTSGSDTSSGVRP